LFYFGYEIRFTQSFEYLFRKQKQLHHDRMKHVELLDEQLVQIHRTFQAPLKRNIDKQIVYEEYVFYLPLMYPNYQQGLGKN
jgi:hypothetical protein